MTCDLGSCPSLWLVIVVLAGCGAEDGAVARPSIEPPAAAEAPIAPVERPLEATAPLPPAEPGPEERAVEAAAERRSRWISEPFRCRAISTTRLRSCRFVEGGGEVAITFPVADLRCDRVVFDEHGDPARLESCRSTWIRVPETIELARSGDTWSGSHSGWTWVSDRERYCCPGVWITASPAISDESTLDPIDADHDVPLPKPPGRARRRERRRLLPG